MPVKEIEYRPASLEDLATLRELEQKVVEAERPYNSSIRTPRAIYYDIPYLIDDNNSYLIVGEKKNEIIATGYVQIRQSKASLEHVIHGYLGFMYVSENYRGQGLNQNVMAFLMSWAKEKGVRDFYLDVYADNVSAISAYGKMGFKPNLIEMKLQTED